MYRKSITGLIAGVVLAGTALTALPANAYPCYDTNPGWRYRNVQKVATAQRVLGGTHSVYNNTSATARMTLTSSTTGTVSLSASVSTTAEMKAAIVASVKATVTGTATTSLSVTTSNTVAFNVPARSIGNGTYGVFRVKTTGRLVYLNRCGAVTNDQGTVTSYSPYRIGWKIWTESMSRSSDGTTVVRDDGDNMPPPG